MRFHSQTAGVTLTAQQPVGTDAAGDEIRVEPLKVEHENFRDAVLGKEADIVTMEQGLTTVRVAEACIESATTGQTISLEA